MELENIVANTVYLKAREGNTETSLIIEIWLTEHNVYIFDEQSSRSYVTKPNCFKHHVLLLNWFANGYIIKSSIGHG